MLRDDFEATIGLEIHVQLATESKIFCGAPAAFTDTPNMHVDPVSVGLPGTLPVLNQEAVTLAVKVGLALGCHIDPTSRFDRKHYFYPDLPKGYQITQHYAPICNGGAVEATIDGVDVKFELDRIHLEEDAGKTVHDATRGVSCVDYNRAGVPLIEVVSKPVMHTPEEAVAFMKSLYQVVVAVGASDGNMEQGNFRCDANVSVRPKGQIELGTRTETKNMNSFRFVGRAIAYEIDRQIDLISSGQKVIQQTRLWDDDAGVGRPMRSKEEAQDYRYFPDPDLMPLNLDPAWIEQLGTELPELPRARYQRFVSEYGLSEYDADVLTQEFALADFFETCLEGVSDPKLVANWVQVELLGQLNRDGLSISQSPVSAEALAQMLGFLVEGKISGKMAKACFQAMMNDGIDAASWVAKHGGQITDTAAIESVVREVVEAHPDQAADYRGGKVKLLGFFVGQVMKATRGKANPGLVNEAVRKILEES